MSKFETENLKISVDESDTTETITIATNKGNKEIILNIAGDITIRQTGNFVHKLSGKYIISAQEGIWLDTLCGNPLVSGGPMIELNSPEPLPI